MKTTVTKEPFVEELANTLLHLYDPGVLQRSLLLPLFGLEQKSNPLSALQKILTSAIEALKPNKSVPPGTNAWQIYHILYYRYVEQNIQRQVANDLALSVRQLRRKEKTALLVLANRLWSQYNLDEKIDPLTTSVQPTHSGIELESSADPGIQSQEQELEWLRKTTPSEPVYLQNLLEGIMETIGSLAQTLDVTVKYAIPENCPPLNVQLMTVRQALLYIITTAVRFTPQGHVEINAQALPGRVSVCMQVKAQRGNASSVDANRGKELEFARKLLQMSRGLLEAKIDPGESTPFIADIILPAAQKIPILVIDDNPDLLGLVQRYLSNTRYEYHGTSDSQAALTLAEQLTPEIILLDVMLPGLDGWELVGRLREHPKTRRSSIIICTILPQEQLALTLGAADFIRKPIRRKELLAALDRQMEQLSTKASPSA
jgi:CheY-like chemotaxis protein